MAQSKSAPWRKVRAGVYEMVDDISGKVIATSICTGRYAWRTQIVGMESAIYTLSLEGARFEVNLILYGEPDYEGLTS